MTLNFTEMYKIPVFSHLRSMIKMAKDLRRFPVGTGGVRPGLFAGLALLCAESGELSANVRGDFFVCGEGDAREEVGSVIDFWSGTAAHRTKPRRAGHSF